MHIWEKSIHLKLKYGRRKYYELKEKVEDGIEKANVYKELMENLSNVMKEDIDKFESSFYGFQATHGTLLDIASYANGLACQKFRPINDEYLPVIKIREMREGFTENTEKVRKDISERYKPIKNHDPKTYPMEHILQLQNR